MTISDTLISLDTLTSLLAACLVLLLGSALSRRVAFLARYSIPVPIIGGILFAVAATLLVRTSGRGIALADTGIVTLTGASGGGEDR